MANDSEVQNALREDISRMVITTVIVTVLVILLIIIDLKSSLLSNLGHSLFTWLVS